MSIDGAPPRPFGWRDKVGYLFGDVGNDFLFLMASAYLLVFYTNVLGLEAAHVGTLFLLARVLDAFTDVGWGRFLDRHRPAATGRFRPWIGRVAVPVALASALMYAGFAADWPYGARLAWAAGTYLLWGSVFYTAINIPYGSMASVITGDPVQRSSLSVFRSAGASVAGVVVSLVPPLFLYARVDGVSQVVPENFTRTALVFSVVAVLCYAVCATQVRERVRAPARPEPRGLGSMLAALSRSRALLSLMAANLLLLLGALLTGSMAAYLWLNHFGDGALSGPAQLVNYLPVLLLAPAGAYLTRRFGKKETIAVGMAVAGAIYLALYVAHVTQPWVFIVLVALAGFGVGTFTLLAWALITDVIDDLELRTGERDDGTVYAVNTWARKLGQAVAGGVGGYALTLVGFRSGQATQSASTVEGIYTTSTLVPGILFLVVAAVMAFWYPLGRARVAATVDELSRRREPAPAAP